MLNTQAEVLRKIKATAGMLNTLAEFLRKIKAPAGMLEALPCLTNTHFVCRIQIIHAQDTFLYTQYTYLCIPNTHFSQKCVFREDIQKTWCYIPQFLTFFRKVAISAAEEPPGVAIWATEEPYGRGSTHPLFLMQRNSLERQYSEARTA